jgi:signal transduction histidine kinase
MYRIFGGQALLSSKCPCTADTLENLIESSGAAMAKFTVDTHLFRELGELLVGRDSTALVELIKNSYDADATEVSVWGQHLDKPKRGRIVITDNGAGMTPEVFEKGFLRIASRLKETGDRRSPYYKRRYTGAKGVGRLAAQKLAWNIAVSSMPDLAVYPKNSQGVKAAIDWSLIDKCQTLDDQRIEDAVSVNAVVTDDDPGTTIELTNLRGKWTSRERTRVIWEVTTFQPPTVLLERPPVSNSAKLLFDRIRVRDVRDAADDPGFDIQLLGDFDVGEEYWSVVAQAADWVLEINARREAKSVDFLITPTKALLRDFPDATQHEFHWESPALDYLPSLNARILIREGSGGVKKTNRQWLVNSAGVRVYSEGFRVLPYGEPGDDWLEIDADYTARSRSLRYLTDADLDLTRFGAGDEDVGLLALRNSSYFGAVFLTRDGTPDLEMLVNREGFVPSGSFQSMQRIVRTGIDLSVRVRAFEKQEGRAERRQKRAEGAAEKASSTPIRMRVREEAEASAQNATQLAREARTAAAAGQHDRAEKLIVSAVKQLERSTGLAGELITDRSIMQVLAGVGLQMSSFVHEMNALLGMASAVEAAIASLRQKLSLDRVSRSELARVEQSVADLRRVVERQASYLADITAPDARRRRSRLKLSERFDASARLVARAAEKRHIAIENKIPVDLRSPPMFPAELMVVFSNLLSNAIKAAKRNGTVRASGKVRTSGATTLRLENTGRRVTLSDSEKWFLPFKSTTVEADPVLGQGMGMGLPIVRNILEEYGAQVQFVAPAGNFATAIEIAFPS